MGRKNQRGGGSRRSQAPKRGRGRAQPYVETYHRATSQAPAPPPRTAIAPGVVCWAWVPFVEPYVMKLRCGHKVSGREATIPKIGSQARCTYPEHTDLPPQHIDSIEQGKVRPAVVITVSQHDVKVCPLGTRHYGQGSRASAATVNDWKAAGLTHPSMVMPRVAQIERRLVSKMIGTLSPSDWAAVQELPPVKNVLLAESRTADTPAV